MIVNTFRARNIQTGETLDVLVDLGRIGASYDRLVYRLSNGVVMQQTEFFNNYKPIRAVNKSSNQDEQQ